jgi:hypothetical protein
VIVLVAAVLAALAVPVPDVHQAPPWQDWKYARPIELPANHSTAPAAQSPTELIRFALPGVMYGQAQPDLEDLRVIDASGVQQPFAIDQFAVRTEVLRHDATMSEQGFVAGRYSQAVADVGTAEDMHDVLTIETDADQFSTWVEVAASDDERTWRIVRQRAPIFRFRADGFEGSLDVRFDRTRSRWLRIRVLDPSKAFPITGCSVADVVEAKPDLVTVAGDLRPDRRSPAKQTRVTVDLGSAGIPASEVRFAIADKAFHRAVAVLSSADGTNWNDVYDCEIYRDDLGGASLSFGFPEGRGRFWRLVVFNRDDAPLQGLRASLLATPRYVSFRARAGTHYRVIFGNPRAAAPEYDFASSTSAEERVHAPLATLGRYGEAMNPTAPLIARPWTETHAGIVWAALLLAVIVLAWIALRAMRST